MKNVFYKSLKKMMYLGSFAVVVFVHSAFAQIETKPAASAENSQPSATAGGTSGSASGGSTAPVSGGAIQNKKQRASDRLKLEFEEDLVEGGLENTELNFIQTRKENNFKKMIKIRENFIPEVEGSASELGSK